MHHSLRTDGTDFRSRFYTFQHVHQHSGYFLLNEILQMKQGWRAVLVNNWLMISPLKKIARCRRNDTSNSNEPSGENWPPNCHRNCCSVGCGSTLLKSDIFPTYPPVTMSVKNEQLWGQCSPDSSSRVPLERIKESYRNRLH